MKLYQPEFGDYPDMFANLFPEFQWQLYDVYNGQFPADVNECEVYMATGSKHSVYENLEWINELKKFVRTLYQLDKYFVGFCFGHQLMGAAMGGEVSKSPYGWCVGVHEFEILKEESWMTPIQHNINLLMMCQDQVLTLPEQATVLARSPKCPFGIIKIGKHMLGIQAHPEFSKEYDKMLMETRMNRMGDEIAQAGIQSLSADINPEIIRSWVLNFIDQ